VAGEFKPSRAVVSGGDQVYELYSRCTKGIRQRPLTAIGLAAAAGFIFGGGAGTGIGKAAASLVAKSIVSGAVAGLLAGIAEEHEPFNQ
jgi:hypothetical protein